MSGNYGQNNKTLNVDTLFVRDIYFRDFANNPIPANLPFVSRGDGGTYFTSSFASTIALPAINAITASTVTGPYQFAPIGVFNTFSLNPGAGMEFYSNAQDGGLIIYNIGPEQIIADGQVLPFTILPDYTVGGRTLQYIGTGDTYLQVSDATIFFNSVYNSSISTVLFLQSTTIGLEYQLNSSISILNSLITSTGLYNYNLISSYFLTPNVINISTVSTSLLVLNDNYIQDIPLRDSVYDPCIVYTGSTILSTNTDFLTFNDIFSGVTFAIDKEFLFGSSTLKYGPSTTTVTRGQQVQLGWFPTLSTQTNTQSLRAKFVPVVQQIQVLEQLVSTGSYLGGGLYSTTTNYYMKNIGRFDEICNPTKISLISPVIAATLRYDNTVNNSWIQYDTATSSIVWGTNGGSGSLQSGSNYGDYAFWNGSAWATGFSTISIGDQAGGGFVTAEGQGEAAIAIGAAAGYSTQGAYAVAMGYTAGQYAQRGTAIAIGNAAGNSNQGSNSIALGSYAGNTYQGNSAVAIGDNAGSNQSSFGVAIGYYAGNYNQRNSAVAIGSSAGRGNQEQFAVAIGAGTGSNNQSSFSVAIGYKAGYEDQRESAIAIGSNAGSNSQGAKSIAIGAAAGQLSQGSNAVAIGNTAGYQQSYNSVSIGLNAGFSQQQDAVAIGSFAAASHQHQASIAIGNSAGFTQSSFAIAIGYQAGSGDQSELAIAIGYNAGYLTQGNNTVAIGAGAGCSNQGQFAVAIGAGAGSSNQSTCTIVLNATGFELDTVQASSFYVAPIRYDSTVTTSFLQYNTTTKEVVWNTGTSTMTQSLIPDVDNEYDIGTSTLRLRHLYVGPSSLTIGTGSISADNGGNLYATNASGTTVSIGGGGGGGGSTTDIYSTLYTSSLTASTINGIEIYTSSLTVSSINGMQFTGPLATENFCVAVGFGPNYLAYSYDGLTWTPTPTANPFIDNSNAGFFTSWNGSLWISGGYDDTTSYNTLTCSSDGIHWLSGESPFDSYFTCAAWNGTMWIGGGYNDGSGATLASSYDGIHWTAVNFGDFSVCLGIAWNGTMWVAVGVSPFGPSGIYYSYDGFNWTSANVDYVGQCVAWNGKMWVVGTVDVGSAYETIFYSYDGINWNLANSSLQKNCYCIAWNGSVWVAGAGEGPNNPNPNTPYETIAYSTDGINWSLSESVFEFACSSVAWNGSIFVVTGDDNVNSLGYSYNGDLFFPIANSVFSPGPYGGYGVSSRKVLPYVGTSPIPFTRMSTIAYGAGAGGIGQGLNAIAIGYNAGLSTQGVYSIAVGTGAGLTCQGSNAVAVGAAAGLTYQSTNAVAIGAGAGQDYQGPNSVAVGAAAGLTYQGSNAVAVGFSAGITYQSDYSIAMGYLAGSGYQSTNAIAIGHSAGNTSQGAYTIALGAYAGLSNQHDNTIVLNATGVDFNTIGSNSFYVSPIRSDVGASNGNLLYYDTGTGEIIYDTTKTFVINHPKDESKYLVHACLEGPEAGVYYRGTGTIAELETSVEVELPDYVDALAVDLTVQVTPIYNGSVRVLNASCVSNNKFTVYGDSGDFWWHVYGRRASVVVEPKKSSVSVLGEGPYRWIA